MEVSLKPCLGSEQTMGTNLVYASTGCPKKWTIQNRYGYTYAKIAYFQPYPFRTGEA
jgi:hypothetical protein